MPEEHIWNKPKDLLVFYVNGKKVKKNVEIIEHFEVIQLKSELYRVVRM